MSLFTLGLIDNIRGPFYPEILKDLGLSGTKGSSFFAVTSFVATLGSFYSHKLIHRFSTLKVMLAASFVFGIGFILVSYSMSWISLVLACAVFGWAFGTLNVTHNVLVCEASNLSMRRRWLSGLHGMYGISALSAPLLASLFRDMGLDWRQSFVWIAIPPILLTLAASQIKFRTANIGSFEQKGLVKGDWLKCLFYAALMSAYLWGELSASTRLALWLRSERSYSAQSADILLALFFLSLLSGRVVFTLVHFPRITNWMVLGGSALLGSVLYFMGLQINPIFVVLAAFAMSPFYPVLMDQCSVAFGDKTAQAMALIIAIGNMSLVLMHIAIGWLGDIVGITMALHCGVVALLLVFFMVLMVHYKSHADLHKNHI